MTLITQMVSELDLERPLHRPLRQLREQAAGPDDLLLRPRAGPRLITDLVRQRAAHIIRQAIKEPSRKGSATRSKILARDPRSID